MPVAYLTRSWAVVDLDFGLPVNLMPPVLHVRLAPDFRTTTTAWLVTPELLAHLCWRVASANAAAPPGHPDALKRLERWFGVLDSLGAIYERLKGKVNDCYERYNLTNGPPPLPTPPVMTVLRTIDGVEVYTPWDSPEVEKWYADVETGVDGETGWLTGWEYLSDSVRADVGPVEIGVVGPVQLPVKKKTRRVAKAVGNRAAKQGGATLFADVESEPPG